jgi:hypothetical protein
MEKLHQKIITVGMILGVDIACLILFAGVLKWI